MTAIELWLTQIAGSRLPPFFKMVLPLSAGSKLRYHACSIAGVAELADAPDSKSGSRKRVWVRFPPPA
jgi:hypothetical protein